jgi:hypothetical protein
VITGNADNSCGEAPHGTGTAQGSLVGDGAVSSADRAAFVLDEAPYDLCVGSAGRRGDAKVAAGSVEAKDYLRLVGLQPGDQRPGYDAERGWSLSLDPH